jgi:hypothetical protein
MPTLKKIAMFPLALLAACGYLVHVYAVAVAALFAHDEKRVALAVYVENQKLLADGLKVNLK